MSRKISVLNEKLIQVLKRGHMKSVARAFYTFVISTIYSAINICSI